MTELAFTDEIISNNLSVTCQVGRDLIFQIKELDARLLRKEYGKKKLSVMRTMQLDKSRFYPCLTSPSENQVFVIGGYKDQSVSRYSISEDRWDSMPELNIAIFIASACTISGHIYLIANYK